MNIERKYIQKIAFISRQMLNARAQHQLDFKSHRKLSARKRRECNNSESLIIFKQVLFSIRVLFPLNLFDSLHEPFFEELKRKKIT